MVSIERLNDYRHHGDIVPGCFIMCPVCEVGSHHDEWLEFEPSCCGGRVIDCPDCGCTHCMICGEVLDIAPPFHSGYTPMYTAAESTDSRPEEPGVTPPTRADNARGDAPEV